MTNHSLEHSLHLLAKICWPLLLLAISLYLGNQQWSLLRFSQTNLKAHNLHSAPDSAHTLVTFSQLSLTRIMSVIIAGLSLAAASLLLYEAKNLV